MTLDCLVSNAFRKQMFHQDYIDLPSLIIIYIIEKFWNMPTLKMKKNYIKTWKISRKHIYIYIYIYIAAIHMYIFEPCSFFCIYYLVINALYWTFRRGYALYGVSNAYTNPLLHDLLYLSVRNIILKTVYVLFKHLINPLKNFIVRPRKRLPPQKPKETA